MVMGPAELGPENDCAGEDQQQINDRPILSSKRAHHINKPSTVSQKQKIPRQTGRVTFGRNITLTLTLISNLLRFIYESVVRWQPADNYVSTKAEEFPLLGTVT
jgi:hypothetical protein